MLVLGVGEGGEVATDETVDSVLGTGAAAFVATAQLTGKAGQAAQTVGKLGEALSGWSSSASLIGRSARCAGPAVISAEW